VLCADRQNDTNGPLDSQVKLFSGSLTHLSGHYHGASAKDLKNVEFIIPDLSNFRETAEVESNRPQRRSHEQVEPIGYRNC